MRSNNQLMSKQKPNGYWTEERTIEALKKIIIEFGHFPTQKELNKIGRGDLTHAVHHHGGMAKFRNCLVMDYLKPNGYWTPENTQNELKELVVKLGYMPSYNKFAEINRCDLLGAIDKYGESLNLEL